jgi:hypothetical protein
LKERIAVNANIHFWETLCCRYVTVQLGANKPGFSTPEVSSSYEKLSLTKTIGSYVPEKPGFWIPL